MTETGRFSLNSILSAVLFASRACIGMFLINIKFMFRPNIQCERNRGKKKYTSSHANTSSHCEITEATFPAHFQFRGLKNSQGFSCENIKIIRGLNCELNTVLRPTSNLSSLFLSEVVKRCPASSQNTDATIKPHLSGAGTLGSTDDPKELY